MNNDKFLSLTLVDPDTHRYFDGITTLGGPSAWIKLDKYRLLKLQTEAYAQNDIARAQALQKEIDAKVPKEIEEIWAFIFTCFDSWNGFDGWKNFNNALITIAEPWREHWEDYYLTEDVKQSLKLDHLELIEDNDTSDLMELLLPLYEVHHLDKSHLLINTPFNNHIGDGIQAVYDYEHHYVTDDQDVFNEYGMYCNSDEDRVRVDQYLSNLTQEYGCQYVDHEFRRVTNQRMHVKSTRGDFIEINNGLSELLQCVVCAYHDLKNALEKGTN